MDMPQPTEGHKRLDMLVGNWAGDEHMHPSQWVPEAVVAQGRSDCRMAAGGFAVTCAYEQTRDGKTTFSGHGVYHWDPKEGCVKLHWWDSMGMGPEQLTGKFEGNVLIMESKGPMGSMRMRGEYTDDGKLISSSEISQDGKTWAKTFDATYTRS